MTRLALVLVAVVICALGCDGERMPGCRGRPLECGATTLGVCWDPPYLQLVPEQDVTDVSISVYSRGDLHEYGAARMDEVGTYELELTGGARPDRVVIKGRQGGERFCVVCTAEKRRH
jgi:hypothetical protein